MNTKTNIFYYAPKELSTDAFLTWILYFLDSSDKYYKEKQVFFDKLILKQEDRGKEIYDVSVSKQKNNVDVLLRFKIKADDREFCVLFEDKTWSTYHKSGKKGVNQLEKYKTIYPNCYRYIYFKLAYMDNNERRVVSKEKGYEILTSYEMFETLSEIRHIHPLVEMYCEYLDGNFVAVTNSFKDKLFKDGNYSVLKKSEAQKFLCDCIMQEMNSKDVTCYGVKYDSSIGGNRYSEINITDGKNSFGERLFWRIDKRSKGYHIRLTQYSGKPYNKKQEHNKMLRDCITKCLGSDITIGDCSNKKTKKGKLLNGMDVVVIPFESNNLKKLISYIPEISSFIAKKYNEILSSDL